jgi:hypothetical protein
LAVQAFKNVDATAATLTSLNSSVAIQTMGGTRSGVCINSEEAPPCLNVPFVRRIWSGF